MPLRIATEEQRRRRAVFSATLRAAVFWVPAGVARSTSIRTDTGASLAPWPAPKPQAARIMLFPGQHTRHSTPNSQHLTLKLQNLRNARHFFALSAFKAPWFAVPSN